MSTDRFSKKAIDKAVRSAVIQSPFTLYPTVLGVIGLGSVALFEASWVTIGLTVAGFSIGTVGVLVESLMRGSKHAMAHLAAIHEKTERERLAKLNTLTINLEEVGADDAANQLQLFVNKFDNFQDILSQKFQETELTYARYLCIAEQVFLAGLDNLEQVHLSLKSVSAIDLERLQRNITSLEGLSDQSSVDERQALMRRQALNDKQMSRVADLTLQNEKALTELDEVTTKLASVKTTKGHADYDMDMAMEELGRLAKRTDNYGIN